MKSQKKKPFILRTQGFCLAISSGVLVEQNTSIGVFFLLFYTEACARKHDTLVKWLWPAKTGPSCVKKLAESTTVFTVINFKFIGYIDLLQYRIPRH